MKNLRSALIVFILILSSVNSIIAQDKTPVKFGKIKIEDFDVKAPSFDSGANAVVVADWGSSEFVANTTQLT